MKPVNVAPWLVFVTGVMTSLARAQSPAATPQLAPGSGTYPRVAVVVTCETPNATIRYTTDGSEPTEIDDVLPAGAALVLQRAAVLKVRAWAPGYEPSAVARGDYIVTGAVAIGASHVLMSKGDGNAYALGSNSNGQLGCGSCGSTSEPIQITALSDVVGLAAGASHSLAVTRSGQVWGWGANGAGQVGDGTDEDRSAPVLVWDPPVGWPGLEIVAVDAGPEHSLAVSRDGGVYAWGNNSSGRLGDGTTTTSLEPIAASVLSSGVTSVAAGGSHSMALRSDGTTWVWGLGAAGQLGDGPCPPDPEPCQYVTPNENGLSGVTTIAAGDAFSLALRPEFLSTRVWSWGTNESGQLGIGSEGGQIFSPASGPAAAVALAAGDSHAIALMADGKVRAWGANSAGQIGDGTGFDRSSPIWALGTEDAVAIAAGQARSGLIHADGSVYLWGADQPVPQPIPGFRAADNAAWMMGDADADGLVTAAEYRAGSDPLAADTNGDGLDDGAAVATNRSTSSPDTDEDGVANAAETAAGTDPLRQDTDGDGVADGVDAFPLDPGRNQMPPPNPADTTPPEVAIYEPVGAIPVP